MIHVLHLHSTFALGGKEARAVRLMNAFGDAARHTIVSAMPDQLGAREAIAPGIRYEIAQHAPPLTGGLSVARYEAIAKFMRRFDLVLTYNWGAIDGVMARRVYPKGMPPVVHHEDGFNADEATRLKPQRNYYRRFALGAAHGLAVPSHLLEVIARRAWKVPAAKLHRIPNGIAVARYAAKPDPKAIPGFRRKKGEFVVGAIAGLREVKDLPLLVRAVGGMPGRTQLVIVGEGPERERIMATAQLMGIADRVHLPGFLPDPHRYVGLFDVLALSSHSEQFPISVVEGMAAGLPIAAPAVGDIREMIAPANVPYIPADRHEVHLRDAIQALAAGTPEGRAWIGEQNRARAVAEYDEATMIARYAALYADAIGRPGAFG